MKLLHMSPVRPMFMCGAPDDGTKNNHFFIQMNKRVATTPLRGNNSRRRLDEKNALAQVTPPKLRHPLKQSPEAKIQQVIVLVPPQENKSSMWQLELENYILSKRIQREKELVRFLELERKFSQPEPQLWSPSKTYLHVPFHRKL